MGSEPKILAILHIFCQMSILSNLEDLSKTCNAIFLFKGKGLHLQPQPCWLHHLHYQHSHGYLATDLNKHFLFNVIGIYWLSHWLKLDLSSVSCTCTTPWTLLISTTHTSEKKCFGWNCTEQFSTWNRNYWKKLFSNILNSQFHPVLVPVVWENLFSYFLPSELVPVAHLEVESFAKPPQPAGAITPKEKTTMVSLAKGQLCFCLLLYPNRKKKKD